jgi:hypothetical protein
VSPLEVPLKLIKRQDSQSGTQNASIMTVFPKVIPAIVDDDGVIKDFLAGTLYLWKSLYDKNIDDLGLLQLAGRLFDLAEPSELATQLQIAGRQSIVNSLWDALHTFDRRRRIAVGSVESSPVESIS